MVGELPNIRRMLDRRKRRLDKASKSVPTDFMGDAKARVFLERLPFNRLLDRLGEKIGWYPQRDEHYLEFLFHGRILGKRFLELGHGAGHTAEQLAQKGAKVI